MMTRKTELGCEGGKEGTAPINTAPRFVSMITSKYLLGASVDARTAGTAAMEVILGAPCSALIPPALSVTDGSFHLGCHIQPCQIK